MDRRAFIGSVALAASSPRRSPPRRSRRGRCTGSVTFLTDFVSCSSPVQQVLAKGSTTWGMSRVETSSSSTAGQQGISTDLPELAADLVRAKVDVIVTSGTPGTRAAKQATQTIPIVFASGRDVVGRCSREFGAAGRERDRSLVGGRAGKGLQLLKEAVPTVVRVVYLYDPGCPPVAQWRQRDLQLIPACVSEWRRAAFAKFRRGTNGLVIANRAPPGQTADQICGLALQRKLPALDRAPIRGRRLPHVLRGEPQ